MTAAPAPWVGVAAIAFFAFIAMPALPQSVANPLYLHTGLHAQPLAPYMDLLEDRSGQLTFAQVREQSAPSGAFRPFGPRALNAGFSDSVWWVRFSLVNTGNTAATYLLRQDYPLIDYIELWQQDETGRWRQRRSGDRLPFRQRDIEHRDFLFILDVPAKTSATYYLSFRSAGPINIGLQLFTPENLLQALSAEQLLHGLAYGAYLVLIAYNLFIFFIVRDKVFLYYLAYLSFTVVNIAIHSGFAFQFLWPDSPDWANRSVSVFAILAIVAVLQFSRGILELRDYAPRLDSLLRIAMVSFACALPVIFWLPYATQVVSVSLLALATALLVLWIVVVRVLSGYAAAFYFLAAWLALLIGIGVYLLKSFGFLPHNVFTQHSSQIGSLVEMLILSLALGSRFRVFRIESRTDALTRLFNRRQFDEMLLHEFKRARRLSQPLTLLLLDVDHFKRLNDRFGHAEGDKILKVIGNILSGSIRKPALPFRFGGEEFAVLLPRTNHSDAAALGERLRKKVAGEFDRYEGITISGGLATLDHAGVDTMESLLHAADSALYQAKAMGRNCVVRFDRTLAPAASP